MKVKRVISDDNMKLYKPVNRLYIPASQKIDTTLKKPMAISGGIAELVEG